MPFGIVSGVYPGIGVLDGVHVPQGEGQFLGFLPHWYNWCVLNRNVFNSSLMREKLTVFLYGQTYRWNVRFIGFLVMQSSSRSMLEFARN